MSERPVLFGERKKNADRYRTPCFKIRFLQKNTVRTVHFREILEIAGFWILSASFFSSAISTVRPVFFCEKCQIRWENAKLVPYVRYFLAVLRKKVPYVRHFLEPKKWPKSVLFLQIRLFLGKIAPSIAFFQFYRPRKNAKCPKNNRNCVHVFQSGSHLSGATLLQ